MVCLDTWIISDMSYRRLNVILEYSKQEIIVISLESVGVLKRFKFKIYFHVEIYNLFHPRIY